MAYHAYQHHHRGRVPFRRIAVALAVVVVVVVALAIVQLVRAAPTATASVVLPTTMRVPGAPPKIPWPTVGAAALEVEGVGSLGGVNAGQALPLASITKLIGALVVLHDHPLSLGASGPTVTITAADAAAYKADLAAEDSVLDVQAGERLTELQLLEGMLIPSGDNVADIVANWDAGSQGAFVSAMNAEAKSLGLDDIHLADAAGLSPSSAGSASDLLQLGVDVLANPVLRSIVDMPQVTLPVAGTVYNYDYDVGHDGIIGIKTGSTPQAGGNFLFAAQRKVDGRVLTAVGVVLGQQGKSPLPAALAVGERLANAAFGAVSEVTLLSAGRDVLTMKAPWGRAVTGKTAAAVSTLGLPGETVSARVEEGDGVQKGLRSLKTGARVGTVELSVAGQLFTDPVLATGSLSPPSLSYRLTRL